MIKLDLKADIFIALLYLLIFNISSFYCYYLNGDSKKGEFYKAINVGQTSQTLTSGSKVPRTKLTYFYNNGEYALKSIIGTLIHDLSSKTCLDLTEENNINKAKLEFGLVTNKFTSLDNPNESKKVAIPQMCTNKPGCIKAQIFFALGMIPPHQRPDRDIYIEVKKENVDKQTCKADKLFEIVPPGENAFVNGGYDFGSIAHIKRYFCYNNREAPISAYIDQYNEMMGRDDGLSFNDVKFINTQYCMNDACEKKVSNECQNYGYKDPNDCTKCICPNGFDGNFCEKMKKSDEACKGGDRYASPDNYNIKLTGNVNCYFNFTSLEHHIIEFHIKKLKTNSDNLICTEGKSFELKHQQDIGTTGLCLCKDYSNIVIRSHSNYAYLIIHGHDGFSLDLDFKRIFAPVYEPTIISG
uniref:Metalloendopeptidase n=1 Tax=Parastrongyloides trichosuri TaxID=131310 RepID=A0A0N5A003_PARTI